MRRAALLLVAAVLMGCAERVPALTSPSATLSATATTDPSPSTAPSHVPGSAVRVTVNGVPLVPGTPGELVDDRASVIVLSFPFAMDRQSVETWLPRDAAVTWTDDATVSLSVPASSGFSGFKIPEARSQDGRTIVDLLVVAVQHPPSAVVSTFTVAELLGGATAPRAGAPRVSGARRGAVVTPSPGGTKVLLGPVYDPTLAPARVFDLATRAATPIPLPRTGAPFITVGWAGEDRIVFAGDRVWVTTLGAASAREVADPGMPLGLGAAAVSPRGSYLAAASRDKLEVVDLATGGMRLLSGYRNDCQPNAGPLARIAWSPDERRIAVVECDAATPTAVRTRMIEIATDRTVATVAGGVYGIAALLTGDLEVSLDYTEHGEGARLPWVVFDFSGVERMRYLGRGPSLSPDGRYLLDYSCCAGEGFSLTDLVTQTDAGRGFAGSAQWLRDGRLLVVTR